MNDQPTTPERLAQVTHGLPPGATAWPAGHRIGSFEFRGVVATRPTSIVYRGWDHGLEVPVALKEYLPGALARRGAYGDIGPAEPALAEPFERGLRAFIAEGRQLARCDHPSLVRVLQLLPAHGGACLVMPWYAGRPLADLRREMAGPPDEPALRALLASLLSALHAWHRVNGVHGAVHPGGVLLLDDDRPLLLGPNLAERALGRHVPPPEPGYAAPEFGGDPARVGAWSDVHALGRLARFALTGLPPAATAGEPLAAVVRRLFPDTPAARYAPALLDAIDRAASPAIAERPQTIAEFAAWIEGATPPRVAAAAPQVDVDLDLAAPDRWPASPDAAAPLPAAPAARPSRPEAAEIDLPLPEAMPLPEVAPLPPGPGADAATPGAGAAPDWSRWPDAAPAGTSADGPLPAGAWGAAEPRATPAWPPAGGDAIPPRAAPIARPPAPVPAAAPTGGAGPVFHEPPAAGGWGGDAPPASPRTRPPAETPRPASTRADPAAAPAGRREPPLMPFSIPAGPAPARAPAPAAADEEPDAATVELIQRVLDSIPPAPPRREPAATAPAGAPAAPGPAFAAAADDADPQPPAAAAEPRPRTVGAGRWALLALALAVLLGGAAWWARSLRDAAPPPAGPASETPAAGPALPESPPVDATPAAATEPAPDALPPPAAPREEFVDPPREPAPAAPRREEPAPAVASPRAACGERTPFSLYRCMQQQCETSAWARHPQCVEFRATDRVPS